jgi:hypothetical protein
MAGTHSGGAPAPAPLSLGSGVQSGDSEAPFAASFPGGRTAYSALADRFTDALNPLPAKTGGMLL